MYNQELVRLLNTLLECLYASYYGYKNYTYLIDDKSMVCLFDLFSINRKKMIDNISKEIMLLNGEPLKDGTLNILIRNVYIKTKNIFTNNFSGVIIEEVKNSENKLIKCYAEVLKKEDLPADIRLLLSMQVEEIKNNLMNLFCQ